MKTTNTLSLTVSRRVLAVVLLAVGAVVGTAAAATPIATDDAVIEALPGRDYSMRLDLAAARFEQIDVRSGAASSQGFSAECAAALAPGLWLAVPAADGALELLPLGLTAAQAVAVVPGCATTATQPATLPPALISQITARGGGVLLVDAAALDNAAPAQVVARDGAR